jgi:hypothetical protein
MTLSSKEIDMRDEPLELAEDAATLVAFGLRPKVRPAHEPHYAELLRRYRVERPLREHVQVIARGLSLSILGDTELGIVLAAIEGGPFAMTLSDYRRSSMTVAERMCHGLIQLAIAAYCFPTAYALDEHERVLGAKISVDALVRYIVDLCSELEQRVADASTSADESLQEAWRVILARAETRGTADGRRSASTLSGMVAHALEQLEAGGLMRKLGDDDGGQWQALGAYRLQVREVAAQETFKLILRAGAEVQISEIVSASS